VSFVILHKTASKELFEDLKTLGKTFYDAGDPLLDDIYLSWLYLDNPAGPATLILVEESNAVIGVMALIPIDLFVRRQTQEAYYAVHVLTHPEHRGKNLFVKMIRYTKELLQNKNTWLIGHPNKSALPGWKRQRMNIQQALEPQLLKLQVPFSKYRKEAVSDLSRLKELPSDFWNKEANESNISVLNSPEFIHWRYIRSPYKRYTFNIIWRRDEMLGFTVTRPLKGFIDLMAHASIDQASAGEALALARKPTILMMQPQGRYAKKALSACWQLPIDKHMPFFVSSWDDSLEDIDFSTLSLAASDL